MLNEIDFENNLEGNSESDTQEYEKQLDKSLYIKEIQQLTQQLQELQTQNQSLTDKIKCLAAAPHEASLSKL